MHPNSSHQTLVFTEREYLLSGATMLTNSLKITDTTKTELLELISFQSDQEISQKNCRADSCSVLDRLTCWLSISVMTFLGIKITLILQSLIQETNNIWSSSFVSKYFKFYVDFRNSEKIWANIFWFGDNYIRIRCVKQSFLLRDNTGYREPLC